MGGRVASRTAQPLRAWVLSAVMGLGHLRAAHALRSIAHTGILIAGDPAFCSEKECRFWERIRHLYYLMSRGEEIPLVGRYLYRCLHALQRIPTFYPLRDLSKPDWSTRYLSSLIRGSDFAERLLQHVASVPLPMIHTFYAPALAFDHRLPGRDDNYLLICDSDFHRIWVPEDPRKSRLRYLAPGTRVKRRLMAYGIPEERISLTGFPLPKENIGSPGRLEILKEDLFRRLVRLDPLRNFFALHGRTVEYYLRHAPPSTQPDEPLTLMFAIGGAGVHSSLGRRVLKSLAGKIRERELSLILSAGTNCALRDELLSSIDGLDLTGFLDNGIRVICEEDLGRYFDEFNAALRSVDVLWTKPSELSFYCALGIPILTAPPVGYHEELNRGWLQDMHAGLRLPGPVEHTGEWLFDLRDSGMLAEAAWEGFLKGRKLGTYKIEELLSNGRFSTGSSPLER